MDWDEFRTSARFAASMTSLAFKFAEAIQKGKEPTPKLRLELEATGGGTGIDFSALVSEVRNQVPATAVHLFAELEGEGVVYEARSFNLPAGELDRLIMFSLARPRYGELVKACNDQTTLYGHELTVVAVSDNGGFDSATWMEDLHPPGSPRYEAMQKVWAARDL